MADIISLDKVSSKAQKDNEELINQLKLKGLKEVTKQLNDDDTKGYMVFTFDAQGNAGVTAAGQIDPGDCCLALDRVRYQIITNEGVE
jgi:hypothetical protein|tara:strand:- start:15691 stop:15954 length:264 start_codon:yes stop_codon:yes gene_type:complete